MGLLVNGVWQDRWYDTDKHGGEFKREDAIFRRWVTPDGSPGPSGEGGFPAETGRYHLYVSLACPWAHRALIFRRLKQLDDLIGVSIVHPDMQANGWEYRNADGATAEPHYGYDYHWQLYTHAKSDYTGRVTVPVLWDTQCETIVSNESAEIIRMFNSAFDGLTGNTDDYYPEALRGEIDTVNGRVYETVNNGVYRSGFATHQDAYEQAVTALFDSLDWLEDRLAGAEYLVGNQPTEADWRLFTTMVRFDAVYHGHFKCNIRRIADYPNLHAHMRRLLAVPGVRDTVDLRHIKRHYYYSHRTINPTGIVPVGPAEPL